MPRLGRKVIHGAESRESAGVKVKEEANGLRKDEEDEAEGGGKRRATVRTREGYPGSKRREDRKQVEEEGITKRTYCIRLHLRM